MKRNRGVTLIALVVTIVVMMILAMISVAVLTGGGGPLNAAMRARRENKRGEIKEKTQVEVWASEVDNDDSDSDLKIDMNKLKENIEKNMGVNPDDIVPGDDGDDITFPYGDDFYVEVDPDGTVTVHDDPVPSKLQEGDIVFKMTPSEWTTENVMVEITTKHSEYAIQYTKVNPDKENSWVNYSTPVEMQENGLIFARLVNKSGLAGEAGNYATANVMNIDRIVPEIKGLEKGQGYTSVELTGKAKDTLSGIAGYQFSQSSTLTASSDGWKTVEPTTEEQTYTQSVTKNGAWYFYVKDRVGNISKESSEVQTIDTTSPTVSISASSDYMGTLTGTVTDTESGIVGYKFSQSSVTPTDWTEVSPATTTPKTYIYNDAAAGTWYLYAIDAMGNVGKAQCTVTRDTTPPTVSISANVGELTGTARDTESGLVGYIFTTASTAPSSGWTDVPNTTVSKTFTGKATSSTTWYLYAKDRAGNIGKASTTVVLNTKPTFTQLYTSSKTTTSLTIYALAKDDQGGTLTYKLYNNSGGALVGIQSATAGTAVSFTWSNLSNYSTYNYYCIVTDNGGLTDQTSSSGKTKCPGTGKTCNAYTTYYTCSKCSTQSLHYHCSSHTSTRYSSSSNKCTYVLSTTYPCSYCGVNQTSTTANHYHCSNNSNHTSTSSGTCNVSTGSYYYCYYCNATQSSTSAAHYHCNSNTNHTGTSSGTCGYNLGTYYACNYCGSTQSSSTAAHYHCPTHTSYSATTAKKCTVSTSGTCNGTYGNITGYDLGSSTGKNCTKCNGPYVYRVTRWYGKCSTCGTTGLTMTGMQSDLGICVHCYGACNVNTGTWAGSSTSYTGRPSSHSTTGTCGKTYTRSISSSTGTCGKTYTRSISKKTSTCTGTRVRNIKTGYNYCNGTFRRSIGTSNNYCNKTVSNYTTLKYNACTHGFTSQHQYCDHGYTGPHD